MNTQFQVIQTVGNVGTVQQGDNRAVGAGGRGKGRCNRRPVQDRIFVKELDHVAQ
ncbi:MAG: hypothetical protein R2867_26175 [Caldilineaceae bacterium]